MFAPCTVMLYDSTSASQTLKCPQPHLAFLVESIWFLFWWCPFLSVDCFHKLSFRYHPQKIVRLVEILGMGWPGVIGLMQNESVSWEIMREVFKWFVWEMKWHLISLTEHLNTSGITSYGTGSFCIKPITPGHPIPKISTHLTILWGGYLKDRVCENNPQTKEDIIRREISWIPQEMLNGVVDNFNVRVADVLSTAVWCLERT